MLNSPPPENVKVWYKCKCMGEEREVNVPFRREDEDVKYWVEQVMGFVIYTDHRLVSPDCRMEEVEYVKLPVPENAPFFGGKPKVN